MKFDKATTTSQSPLITFLLEKRKEKQFQQTAELSFTFIFICFFLFFAIRPTVLTISNLVGEIKAKQAMSLNLKNQINTIIQAQTAFGEIQSNYDLITSCLPERYSFSHTSNQIVGIANQAALVVDDISFGLGKDKDEKIPYFSYSLSTPINFQSLSSLVNGFKNNIRLMKINSISINPFFVEKTPTTPILDSDQVTINLTTQIFYLPK